MSYKSNAENIFLGVLAITTVRDFLEVALEGKILLRSDDPMYSLKNYFLHFNSFYFLVYALMSLVLYFFARKKTSVSECFRVGALAMILIWIGPLFDYFILGAFDMIYPRDPLNVVVNIHRLFDPNYDFEGLSCGMRVEIFLAGVGGLVYLWYKTRRLFPSFCGAICLVLTPVALGLLIPFLTQYYEYGFHFGYHPLYNSVLLHQGFVVHGTGCKIALLYLFLCLMVFSLAYYVRNPRFFLAIFSNCRWTRSVHYLLLFVAGLIYVYHNPPIPDLSNTEDLEYLMTIWNHPSDIFGIFMASVSILLSFQSAVIFNDIYDYDIDIVSNADRPLVSQSISLSEYMLIGKLFAIIALTVSFCISETFFFFVLLYLLLSFLYSTPPFRLRNYFLISNVELATIFLVTFHAGAVVLISDYRFDIIPIHITFGLLLIYALALTVKDSKDYEGDKKSNVQTLYTLFGRKGGDIMTAIFVCCAILLTPILLHLTHLLFYSVCVCLLFLLIIVVIRNSRSKERFVVLLYYFYVLSMFSFLIFKHE